MVRTIQSSSDTTLISENSLQEIEKKLVPTIQNIAAAWGNGYDSVYASLSLPSDTVMHASVQKAVNEKKKLNPTIMVVIGIGGSNLGTMAVYEALYGVLYNEQSGMKVYFADTVDADYITSMYAQCEAALKRDEAVLLTIISKSGATTETIANAQIFVSLLEKYKKDYADYVVTITDKDSRLDALAEQEGYTTLHIPALVGGRYSVFCPVGLFPLGMLGVDIEQLVAGAESMKKPCINLSLASNPAAMGAAYIYDGYKNGANIHVSMVFAQALRMYGQWYQQLMGESIGKECDTSGEKVNVGITPIVSVGSVDLHSVGQLYLGGPYDKTTTFISIDQSTDDIEIAKESAPFISLVPEIAGKSYDTMMHAILDGVRIAYAKEKRSFISYEVPKLSAYYMGQLMQMKMVEMMYLGTLLEVNPFDQPNVELYKSETRKILSYE